MVSKIESYSNLGISYLTLVTLALRQDHQVMESLRKEPQNRSLQQPP